VHSEGSAFAYFTQERPAQRAGLCRRTAGWGISQSFIDDREHAFQIPIYFIVPETQHIKPLPEEMTIALGVKLCVGVEIVLATINLDHQPVPQAHEVHNEVVAWGLTTKVVAALAPRAQMHSQLHFLRGHALSKRPCDFVRHDAPTRSAFGRPPSPFGGGISKLRIEPHRQSGFRHVVLCLAHRVCAEMEDRGGEHRGGVAVADALDQMIEIADAA